jgi:hypothetical protein
MLPHCYERKRGTGNRHNLPTCFARMIVFDAIAEQKIVAAIERGELSDLPGAGAPLKLDDDALVPETLRMAYRILRNAGFVPPEVETLRAIGDLERSIAELPEGGRRSRALQKLQVLRLRLETAGRPRNMLYVGSSYAQKLLGHFERQHRDNDDRDQQHRIGNGPDTNSLDKNSLDTSSFDTAGLDKSRAGDVDDGK